MLFSCYFPAGNTGPECVAGRLPRPAFRDVSDNTPSARILGRENVKSIGIVGTPRRERRVYCRTVQPAYGGEVSVVKLSIEQGPWRARLEHRHGRREHLTATGQARRCVIEVAVVHGAVDLMQAQHEILERTACQAALFDAAGHDGV